jgi:nanoRNase/pAp phosphatase (c-di-AMP/oligoRNAs hydrolase)
MVLEAADDGGGGGGGETASAKVRDGEWEDESMRAVGT